LKAERVVSLFNATFLSSHHTQLVGGADEPLYLGHEDGFSRIYFCYDYVSSALHEIAHWCLAGSSRRSLDDYGYWYQGQRDVCQQNKFEQVEVAPQALEWIFSEALGIGFRVSADNLDLADYDTTQFRRAVRDAAQSRIQAGLKGRAATFARLLAKEGVGAPYDKLDIYQRLPE
jgi:elongation factor P hydroxylase